MVRGGDQLKVVGGPRCCSAIEALNGSDQVTSIPLRVTQLVDARTWLESLRDEIAAQRLLLRRLLDAVSGDQRYRWLELSCSIAQGRGDRWSDLDVGLGVADDLWPETLEALPVLIESLGEVVDVLYHSLPTMGNQPHQRAFVQYADGVQLDLVAIPAHLPNGKQPESLILYDPDGLRKEPWDASVLQPHVATIREWAFLGWIALADLAKYLRRGSLWEALERLHEARTQVWRLWAAGTGLRYPVYGLTTVFDHPEAGVPPGIEATLAALDSVALRRAALACAALLQETARVAGEKWEATLPTDIADVVLDRLRDGFLEDSIDPRARS